MELRSKTRWNQRYWARLAGLALVGALVVVGLLIGPSLFGLIPRSVRRQAAIFFLMATQVVYGVVLVICLVAVPSLMIFLIQSRRKRQRQPILARLFLVLASLLFGSVVVEGATAAWRSWAGRSPVLLASTVAKVAPAALRPSSSLNEEISIVVVGESSAEGVPYHSRLSVGEIVAWQLRKAIPNRRVRVDVQARSGLNLAQMHQKLAGLTTRPDIVIIYAGHNEFSSRYAWFQGWPYYTDDRPPRFLKLLEVQARRFSPLCGLIQDAIVSQRIDEPPPPWITRKLVDVPVYTPDEYTQRLTDFRTRLDAMASYCQSIQALAVMVIPPANDAGYEPNRSFLSPQTTKAEREQFARDFTVARDSEKVDPAASLKQYRALLYRQPSFAEAHYRVARLLEHMGNWDEAYQHDIKARNLDGLPMRCPSDFQESYRDVAIKHRAILVDGQSLFHTLSPTGLLDDAYFNDAMHPALRGHIAIAQAILDKIYLRPEFGWKKGIPSPTINPIECAEHFKMDAKGWADACDASAQIWRVLAYARHDPTARLMHARQFTEASSQLKAGRRVEDLKIPGLGLSPLVPAQAGQSSSSSSRRDRGR